MLGPAALLLVWGAALIAALSPFVYLSRMFRFPIFSGDARGIVIQLSRHE